MLRSLSSAISGLKNNQTYMDVVGQNIANVNTVGYKSSRVNFSEALAQTYKVGSAPVAGGVGGTNPAQVGLGVNLGGIDTITTQGTLTSTGKTTDLAIQGEGYFMLGTSYTGTAGAPDQDWTPAYFSRAGAFAKDEQGYLVDPVSGQYVLGAKMGTFTDAADLATRTSGAGPTYTDDNGNAVTSNGYRLDASGNLMLDRIQIDPTWGWASFSISSTGAVSGVKSDGTTDVDPMRRPQVALGTFNNPEGLVRAGGNLYRGGLNSGAVIKSLPGSASGAGTLVSGALESSNVDLAEQFTRMIEAQRGFQANTRIITASDEMLQDLINIKR